MRSYVNLLGYAPGIPSYAALVFELEIHEVKADGKSAQEARQRFERSLAYPKQYKEFIKNLPQMTETEIDAGANFREL